MTEVLFYHLTERTLEQTLPGLLEKSLERGWRAVVQAGSPERVEALDSLLWTWRDESFLAHSASSDANAAHQPVFLTTGDDNPNGARIRFLVDGAVPASLEGYERGVYLFDGHDAEAVDQARSRWKAEKAAGHDITYWQQKPGGGWERKA
ncbi:MAG: DNA polymerase III subunit chi [Nitratireductor sp.]|nr:DNA polymerase III subunit chi [Nitratireductor sp.]